MTKKPAELGVRYVTTNQTYSFTNGDNTISITPPNANVGNVISLLTVYPETGDQLAIKGIFNDNGTWKARIWYYPTTSNTRNIILGWLVD